MEPQVPFEGEFHHFQLVNSEGEVPLSISLLLHLNQRALRGPVQVSESPISSDDVLAFHQALQSFDGDFITAFSKN